MNILRHALTACAALAAALPGQPAGAADSMTQPQAVLESAPAQFPADTASGTAGPLPAAHTDTETPATARSGTAAPSAVTRDSVAELDRMVVTATRTKRQMSDVPVSVSLIDRQTIDASPATRVDDLLMKEAGVSVKRVVGMAEGIPSDIIIRGVPGGFASTRTLILVDGLPTNVAGTPLLIINQVPLEAVDRVELVRGPFSSLYGANAFNGVVNIITRQARNTEEFSGYLEFFPALYADVGVWNGGRFPHLSYSLSGGLRRIDNYLLADSALVRDKAGDYYDPAENYDYEDERVLGRLSWWPNDRISLGLQARYFGCELGFGRTQDDARAEMVTGGQLFLVGPTLTASISDRVDIGVSGYYRRLGAEFLNSAFLDSVRGNVASQWKSYTNDGQVEGHVTLRLGDHNTLTAGADFLGNAVEFGATRDRATGAALPGFDSGSASIANGGVYVQDELRAWDRINVVPGVRLDYHSEIGPVVSPKLACSYRAADWLTARFSAGRAFRAPSLVETSMPAMPLLAGVTLFPTPGLKPEYIWALDAGVDMAAARVFRPTVSAFFNWMEDLITPSVSWNDTTDRTEIRFRNISEAWSAGCELGMDLTLPVWARWYANYTYTYSQDMEILRVMKSVQPLDYVPSHMLNLGLEVRKEIGPLTLSGSVSETYVARRSYLNWQGGDFWHWQYSDNIDYILPDRVWLHDYWRTDLTVRLSYRNHAFIAVNASNLFNARYEESGGVLAPGRLVALRVGGGF